MKIAVIAPPWLPVPPPAYGGTEVVLDYLARGLVDLGHEVLLIAHPDSTSPVGRTSVVPASDAMPMGRAVSELEHVLGAYELAEGCDVISDHTTAGPIVALTSPRPPVVATNHNPFSRGREAIYRRAADRVALVAISHAHAASTELSVSAVVHHGIDVGEFPEGSGDGGYFATLARMSPDKGVHEAARLARSAGVRLQIAARIGSPVEQQYFDEFVRPLLDDRIEFVGEVDAAGKRDLLSGATALLNPTRWAEPFGMTMVEAMACGTPVIGTPRGATVEIVDDGITGYLADDEHGLVDAIGRVADLDRAACRKAVADRFSMAAMASGYIAAYERELIHATPTMTSARAWG